MPRKPKLNHPLQRLRETIEKTQEEFAQMIGVSKALVQKVELWGTDMTEEMALKIRQQTGCVPFRTRKDKPRPNQKVFAFGNEDAAAEHEYTKADFELYQQFMHEFAELEAEDHALAAARCINLLTRARGGGFVLSFCKDFERFVMNAYEQYELEPYVIGLVRDEVLRYIGQSSDPDKHIRGFSKTPLSVAISFLLPTEDGEAGGACAITADPKNSSGDLRREPRQHSPQHPNRSQK